jgi:bifunctional non-homologous end joining protein LigD
LRQFTAGRYFERMGSQRILPPGFVSPCIPTLAVKPPAGPGWVHEIKHDGYRLIVRRKNGILKTFYRP